MSVIAVIFPKPESLINVVREVFKKSRIRGPFDKQHAKPAHTRLKSAREHLYHIY